MTAEQIKSNIRKVIQSFTKGNFTEKGIELFETLGYITERQAPLDKPTFQEFKETYIADKKFDETKAKASEWKYIDLLFQLSKEEVLKQTSSFDTKKVDSTVIETYLFFAIELSREAYSRTELSLITREINRLFPMPAMILFKYGSALTLSVINRRLHKKDESKDVLEKVTLIKDIVIENPHRAHIEILFDLTFDELKNKHQFTNFVELHNAWQKTLDTKELNKKFFIELANWYFWAMDNVHFPSDIKLHDDKKKDGELRNATNLIRLITRVIFIWFIKEKKLVPANLFRKEFLDKALKDFNKNKKAENYYQAILQNLFFGTLNQIIDKREFAETHKGFVKGDQGVRNIYRFADKFLIDESAIKKLFKEVPFLNGGLFDCLDKTDDETKKDFFVDGFTRRENKQASVPDFLFFGEEQEVDLNEFFGTKNKKYKVKGLVNLLESYKFTVAENTPIEEEIALDPELLGKVFENLLASYNPETKSTARKQTGSFYTPREIVNYMVDESLMEYLKQKRNGFPDLENRLRDLFSYSENPNPFNEKETKILIKVINNCKMLDPACGSGAFPMGMLHKMVYILTKLDHDNSKWKAEQEEKIIGDKIKELEKDKNAIEGLSDAAVKEKARKAVDDRLKEIKEIFESENNFDDYSRKLFLIENCIYGVDIQPIAVQIAKLRFFISLIVDQNKQENEVNFGIRSLPNLETKFVAANTLIGLEIPTTDLFSENNPIKILQDELKATRHEYFNAKNRKDKLSLQKQDKELRKKIALKINELLVKKSENELIELQKRIEQENEKLAKIQAEPENIEISETTNLFGETVQTKIDKKKEKLKAQKGLFSLLEKQLKTLKTTDNKEAILKVANQISSFDPYDQNHFANWFEPEWMFGNNLKDGFDIVIGNPPYVEAKKLKEISQILRKFYSTYSGTADLYVYFYENGVRHLKEKGTLVFITSNKFIKTSYGKNLRKYFTGFRINEIVDFTDVHVFEALVASCVFSISKNKIDNNKIKIAFANDTLTDFSGVATFVEQNKFYLSQNGLSEKIWQLENETKLAVKEKIEKGSITLNKTGTVKIFRGVTTGYNPAFIIDVEKRNELLKEDKANKSIIKPMLQGRNIRKWIFNKSDTYLLQTGFDINIKKEYPSILKHLNSFKQELEVRADQGANYWNLRACKYYPEFEKEKIIWGLTSDKWTYAYDNEKNFLPSNGYILTSTVIPIKYLLALLNSRLMEFYFSFIGIMTAGGAYTLKYETVIEFPIKNISLIEQKPFIALVDQILSAKAENPKADTSQLEKQIDEMVYKLYELTDDEIKIIEGKDKTIEKMREAIK